MDDFIKGWKAAIKMVLPDQHRIATFNDEDKFDIFKKQKKLPETLKELNGLLWKAYRQAQAEQAKDIIYHSQNFDFTKYIENQND